MNYVRYSRQFVVTIIVIIETDCILFFSIELQILAGKQRTYSRETSFDTVAERSMSANVTANGDLPDNDRSLLMSKRRGNSVEIETNNNMLKRRGSPGKLNFQTFIH
jgi:hypothetical protein